MSTTESNGSRNQGDAPEGFERRTSRTPVLLLALIVLGSFLAVGYTMFSRSVVYYQTPTEVLAKPGEHVRVSGTVVDGSIAKDVAAGLVTFDVTDGTSTVTVRFEGAAPDTLKDGADAVAEGSLGPDGVFHADKLFAKCPSKFAAKSEQ
jgi:cytochrome c-type biogenesis protein CcmE